MLFPLPTRDQGRGPSGLAGTVLFGPIWVMSWTIYCLVHFQKPLTAISSLSSSSVL